MEASLHGRTALVTGAAKRIGRVIAGAFANEGVNVLVHYKSSEAAAEELCRELTSAGVKSWRLRSDLSIDSECASLIDRALGLAGDLDILINNAAVFNKDEAKDRFDTVEFDGIIRNMRINMWAPFMLSRQ